MKKNNKEIRKLRSQLEALKAQSKVYVEKGNFKKMEVIKEVERAVEKVSQTDLTTFAKKDLLKSLVVSLFCFGIIFAFYFKLLPLP